MMKKLFSFLIALAASVGMCWADPTIYSGFTVTASSGGLENHGAEMLVDGKFSAGTEGTDWTKWSAENSMRSNPSGGPGLFWWVDFNAAEPIAITGYILTSSDQLGQTPTTWTLDAKMNAADDWTTIAGVLENNTLGANALTDVSFNLDVPGTYKYFRLKVSMVDDPWVSGMQLSELRFTGAGGGSSTPEPDPDPDPSNYSIALDDASIADKVTLSANESAAGQTVTVTPAEGYEITSLTVSYMTNNYSVRVKEEYYGDIEDVDPQFVTLPREFTAYPQTGDNGTYTYNDISGGDDKVEYVSGTDNTITFRVTGAFDGIASIEYEYYTQECNWDEELGEDFCWDQTSIQDIQVACSQIGGNAAVSENAGVYSFTMPAGNVTITATVEAIAAPEPQGVEITGGHDLEHPAYYYSTFYDSSVKYALPAGVEAYIATISGNDLLMNKIAVAGQTIPANNAVILKSTVNPFTLAVSDATPVTFSATNDLRGTDVAIATPSNCYVLSGKNGVGFYLYNGANLNPHKAYVIFSGSFAPQRMRFIFEEEQNTTAVDNAEAENTQTIKVIENGALYIIKDGVRYNAQGQIVE